MPLQPPAVAAVQRLRGGRGHRAGEGEAGAAGVQPSISLQCQVQRVRPLQPRVEKLFDAAVYDALTDARPYKEPWPYLDVVTYIRERRGTQFDPDVVDALLDVIERSPPAPADGE